MKNSVSFRARARTIDHLGKGQIADCPTAISELWKNSYDAYARNVALHMFDAPYKCAAIIDNGCGMTLDQLVESWLVVGTDSKSTKKGLTQDKRFGLPERKTQGEKGIGRLSSAFLAPVTLLITKTINSKYAVALIDWRLFENTYLSLSDIDVPIAEIDDLAEIEDTFRTLLLRLQSNLCAANRDDITKEHFNEIRLAWSRFGEDQLDLADRQNTQKVTTEEKIVKFCTNFSLPANIVTTWTLLLDRVKELDGAAHGTALFLLDVERELSLLTNPGDLAHENFEVEKIQLDLIDTLRAFVDPFKPDEENFHYEIRVISRAGRDKTLLRQTDVFTYDDFSKLEHIVQGRIDERGWFSGSVKAFGKEMGIVTVSPNVELGGITTKVGPFKINLGTFENESDKSSHSESEFAALSAQTNKYTGLMIFRDGLRVLPYGRGDNDFFEIEERRGKNAGRYYWARRRIFGQILISQEENSLLKDKAGREGFIKNQAARELRVLVENLLTALADRYFGKKSSARQELLAIVKKERDARKEAQSKARSQTQKSFISDLRRQEPLLTEQLKSIQRTVDFLEKIDSADISKILEVDAALQSYESIKAELRTPLKPPKLGDNEERYRAYRDMYNEFVAFITQLKGELNTLESKAYKEFPAQSAQRHFDRNQGLLNSLVTKKIGQITTRSSKLTDSWLNDGKNDRSLYHQQAIHIVQETSEVNLEHSLNGLDSIYTSLSDSFHVKYDAVIRALDRLEGGINLDSAYSMAEEESQHYEDKAKSLQALAQLGISVEILAHELEELDGLITSGLNSLPTQIKSHPGYKNAFNAHKALTQQIRFLSPLKLSGYQQRQEISGSDIKNHITTFFGDRISRQRTSIVFGERFLSIRLRDLPSRIFPVFVNLINNALYWVSLAKKREIFVDLIGDEVFIANSGPPVDEEDIGRLFELFYSRRANGHGVGLYLCRENLAVAHHKIRYVSPFDQQLISGGANFAINFSGMEQ